MPTARPNGFGRAEVLRRSREFSSVMRYGERRRTAHFNVYLSPGLRGQGTGSPPDRGSGKRTSASSPSGAAPRLGLTVSRKVGKAVVRNALKRRLREFFRVHKSELPRADLVVVAKPGSAGLSYGQVSRELDFLREAPGPGPSPDRREGC